MATLSYAQAGIAGTNPGFVAAAAGGDKIAPNDRGALLVHNAGAGSINVTIVVPGNTKYGLPNPDVVDAVPAGAYRIIGPFPADLADPADGLVAITYSGVTAVNVAPIQI